MWGVELINKGVEAEGWEILQPATTPAPSKQANVKQRKKLSNFPVAGANCWLRESQIIFHRHPRATREEVRIAKMRHNIMAGLPEVAPGT